jgi:outer membrane receptor for ferrienterochelin and colicin
VITSSNIRWHCRHYGLLAWFFISFFYVSHVFAGTTGIIEGKIQEKTTHNPLIGATILLVGTPYGSVADANGNFVIYNIPTGKYNLRIHIIGYKTLVVQNVEIHSDLRTSIVADLEPSAIGMDEVVIQAERPQIEHDITGSTHRVGGTELNALPVTSFTDILGLQAGTTQEGNVRGGKSSEVIYLIDGLAVQDVLSGGLSSELPNSSIVDLTMQTGGFDAEYGNALSGVVNVVTKSGSNETECSVRLDKDDLFGGTENSKNNEVELAMSGPVITDRMFFFFSGNYNATGTRWWQDFQRFFSMPVDQSINGFGKMDLIITPTIRWSNQILFSQHDWRDYEFSWRFNLSGLPKQEKSTYRLASILSHTISDKSFYSLRLSKYHVENTIGGATRLDVDPMDVYQYDFFLQYIISGSQALWSKTTQDIYTAKGDFTTKLGDVHLVKCGVEFNYYDVAADVEKYEPRKTYFGKPLVTLAQLNYSTCYNYFPKSGSIYLQDKIETKTGTIFSLGLRYDFLDPTASRPAIELIPINQNEYQTQVTGYTRASLKQQFSPRVGLAMPLTSSASIFINYGYYFQFPLFDYLYSGLDVVTLQRGASAVLGNPDLEPERTQAWEVSIRQILNNEFVASATYFRKTTTNLVDSKTFVAMDSKTAGDFGFSEYVNNPYAAASGIELVLRRSKATWITGEISYTYMSAEGLSDRASQGLDLAQWGFTPNIALYPLSWDQRHTLKVNADIVLPLDIRANLLLNFYTARPYTYYPSRDGFTPLDSTIMFVPNNRRMQNYNDVDVKLSRKFNLGITKYSVLILYVDVRNLFDESNVRWMDSSGRIGGELNDPGGYFIGRRTHIGMRFDITL